MGTRTPLPMKPNRLFGRIMEWMNGPAYRLALDLIQPQPGQSVLEIGFGTGRLLEMIANTTKDVRIAGIDPTEAMVNMAKARLQSFQGNIHADLRQGPAGALPWGDQSFETVTALHSFQFWQGPQEAVAEIQRVLKPDGRLILILRHHGARPPEWLPNPISRSGDEVNKTISMLKNSGLRSVTEAGNAGSSVALIGTKQTA